MLKRIALIVAFVLVVIILAVAVWWVFFRVPTTPVQNGNVNANVNAGGPLPNINVGVLNRNVNQPIAQGTGVLPEPADIANGGPTRASTLTDNFLANPAQSGQTIMFYDSENDQFFRFNPKTGEAEVAVTQRFPDVQKVTWSPDASKAVLEFPDDAKILYDFNASKQYTLPKEAQDFSFSKDNSRIAYEYIGLGPDQQFLVAGNADGTATRVVTKLADNADRVQVAWSPSDDVVGLYRKGLNATQQEVIFIGQNQENFKSLPVDGQGFRGFWTPDGEKLLYTVHSERTNWNPEMHLVYGRGDRIGQGDTTIGLQTFVNKCSFTASGSYAFCAVPDTLDRGSGLYPEFAADKNDSIYSINLTSGSVAKIATPINDKSERFSISSLFIESDESALYATDTQTGKLFKIRLR